MKVTTTFTIGGVGYAVEVEDENANQAFHEAILTAPRAVCNECGDVGFESKELITYKTKEEGYVYVKVICACGAESTLGQYKAGGVFWKPYETNPHRQGQGAAVEAEPDQPPRPRAPATERTASASREGWGFDEDPLPPGITEQQVQAIRNLQKRQSMSNRDVQDFAMRLVQRDLGSLMHLSEAEAADLIRELNKL